MNKFIFQKHSDINFPFDEKPTMYFKRKYGYGSSAKVDPFPCAAHNPKIMRQHVKETTAKFPIPAPVYWVVMPFEAESRTNAWASSGDIYKNDHPKAYNKYGIEGYITFSGKRTIVHPAMTKYLVAHEYGHIVDYYISARGRQAGEKDHYWFRKAYAKMRGIKYNDSYGGGKRKDSIAEVIADDFRIAVAGVDTDFYVHTCTHPLKSAKVKKFWAGMIKKYAITKNQLKKAA